jgi:hypothetical protein
MTSTYTTNLRFEKQGDGENPNSWGTKINAVTDLVDEALTAYTTITVSSVDVTLTSNNGSADQSRSAFIEVVGTLTESVDLIIPAVKKGYVVFNNATVSAGTSITIKTAAGTGANIASSAIQMVICDSVSVHSLNATGFGLGTASALNIGTSINELVPVSLADVRYVTTSAAQTVTGAKVFTSVMAITGAPVFSPKVSLTDAASIALDLGTGTQFHVRLGGNRTLAAPTNAREGQTGHIYLYQDGTGSRTLAYNTNWKFASGTAPTLTTSINSTDILVYSVRTSTAIDGFIVNDLKR